MKRSHLLLIIGAGNDKSIAVLLDVKLLSKALIELAEGPLAACLKKNVKIQGGNPNEHVFFTFF